MVQITLEPEELRKDGNKLIWQLGQEGFEVTAAFWLKTSEDGQWFMYIASPFVDEQGPTKAYRRVYALIRKVPSPFAISPLEVKLIGASEPLARAVVEIQRRYADRGPVVLAEGQLGDVSIDGAYIYPSTTGISQN